MDIENKTTEKLEGELIGLKIISIVLVIVVTLLLSICIYGLLFKENNTIFIPLLVVGISCGTITPLLLLNIKKIKNELVLRK